MKNAAATIKKTLTKTALRLCRILQNERGDFYISDGVRVIIAVVLGALLLGAITLLFNSTIIPRITTAITDLFS